MTSQGNWRSNSAADRARISQRIAENNSRLIPMENPFSHSPLSDQDIGEDFGIEIFEHLNDNVARDYIAKLQHLRQEIWFLKSVSNQRPDLWSASWRTIGRTVFILDDILAELIPGRNRSEPGLFRRK